MSKPSISIIIPIYNQARVINRCLKSIFNQTFKDFEVITVNDGSTDKIRMVLRPWESKIKIINLSKNSGAPKARNIGFKESSGKYVIFCDADIVMKPYMLKKMYDTLETKRLASYTYCSFRFGWKKFKLGQFSADRLKKMPYIPTTSMIRREHFPGFDESLKKFQDWDLWLTMMENGHEGVWIDEILFQAKTGGTMSKWLPKIFYKFSWLRQVRKYKEAKKIIQKKHNL